MKPLTIKLPFPPSVNSVYRYAVRGKHSVMFMTEKGKDYYRFVAVAISNARIQKFGNARLKMVIEVYPPDRKRRDLGNLDKVLSDSLEKAKVFNDDSQIDDLHYKRKSVVKGGYVIVYIKALSEEQTQLEMNA